MGSNQRFSSALDVQSSGASTPGELCARLRAAAEECLADQRMPERDYAVRLIVNQLACLFGVDGRGDPEPDFNLISALDSIEAGQKSILDFGRSHEDVIDNETLKRLVQQCACACGIQDFRGAVAAFTDAVHQCQDLHSLELARMRAAGKLPRP